MDPLLRRVQVPEHPAKGVTQAKFEPFQIDRHLVDGVERVLGRVRRHERRVDLAFGLLRRGLRVPVQHLLVVTVEQMPEVYAVAVGDVHNTTERVMVSQRSPDIDFEFGATLARLDDVIGYAEFGLQTSLFYHRAFPPLMLLAFDFTGPTMPRQGPAPQISNDSKPTLVGGRSALSRPNFASTSHRCKTTIEPRNARR